MIFITVLTTALFVTCVTTFVTLSARTSKTTVVYFSPSSPDTERVNCTFSPSPKVAYNDNRTEVIYHSPYSDQVQVIECESEFPLEIQVDRVKTDEDSFKDFNITFNHTGSKYKSRIEYLDEYHKSLTSILLRNKNMDSWSWESIVGSIQEIPRCDSMYYAGNILTVQATDDAIVRTYCPPRCWINETSYALWIDTIPRPPPISEFHNLDLDIKYWTENDFSKVYVCKKKLVNDQTVRFEQPFKVKAMDPMVIHPPYTFPDGDDPKLEIIYGYGQPRSMTFKCIGESAFTVLSGEIERSGTSPNITFDGSFPPIQNGTTFHSVATVDIRFDDIVHIDCVRHRLPRLLLRHASYQYLDLNEKRSDGLYISKSGGEIACSGAALLASFECYSFSECDNMERIGYDKVPFKNVTKDELIDGIQNDFLERIIKCGNSAVRIFRGLDNLIYESKGNIMEKAKLAIQLPCSNSNAVFHPGYLYTFKCMAHSLFIVSHPRFQNTNNLDEFSVLPNTNAFSPHPEKALVPGETVVYANLSFADVGRKNIRCTGYALGKYGGPSSSIITITVSAESPVTIRNISSTNDCTGKLSPGCSLHDSNSGHSDTHNCIDEYPIVCTFTPTLQGLCNEKILGADILYLSPLTNVSHHQVVHCESPRPLDVKIDRIGRNDVPFEPFDIVFNFKSDTEMYSVKVEYWDEVNGSLTSLEIFEKGNYTKTKNRVSLSEIPHCLSPYYEDAGHIKLEATNDQVATSLCPSMCWYNDTGNNTQLTSLTLQYEDNFEECPPLFTNDSSHFTNLQVSVNPSAWIDKTYYCKHKFLHGSSNLVNELQFGHPFKITKMPKFVIYPNPNSGPKMDYYGYADTNMTFVCNGRNDLTLEAKVQNSVQKGTAIRGEGNRWISSVNVTLPIDNTVTVICSSVDGNATREYRYNNLNRKSDNGMFIADDGSEAFCPEPFEAVVCSSFTECENFERSNFKNWTISKKYVQSEDFLADVQSDYKQRVVKCGHAIAKIFRGLDGKLYDSSMNADDKVKFHIQPPCFGEDTQFYTNNSYIFTCIAHAHFIVGNLTWKIYISEHNYQLVEGTMTHFDLMKGILVSNVSIPFQSSDVDYITCEGMQLSHKQELYSRLKTEVQESVSPSINGEAKEKLKFEKNVQTSINCMARARPFPSFSFNRLFSNGSSHKINETDEKFKVTEASTRDEVVLTFLDFDKDDEGTYECIVSNSGGTESKVFDVSVEPEFLEWYFYVGGLVIIVILSTCILGVSTANKLSKMMKRIKLCEEEIYEFFHGNVKYKSKKYKTIDKDSTSSDPLALPYNQKLEVEFSSLEFDKSDVLGQGQFGVVYRGKLKGQVGFVAIKTTKSKEKNAEQLRSLLMEIKMMSFVQMHETHENVMGIIGAYTQKLKNGVLYLVSEWCEFGSLYSFLRQQDSHLSKGGRVFLPVQYKNVVTTDQFIGWLKQIASGMTYLTHLKILHLDLATRNVLLTDNLTAKITDFGLSRKLKEQYYVYKKAINEPMPVQWMAPESLSRLEFSEKSDVWSFGVLMWELYQLGAEPYSGVANQDLLAFLWQGQRLQKPTLASLETYEIMKTCWKAEPEDRPQFKDLLKSLVSYQESTNGYIRTAQIV